MFRWVIYFPWSLHWAPCVLCQAVLNAFFLWHTKMRTGVSAEMNVVAGITWRLASLELQDDRRSLSLHVVLVQAKWQPWGQEVHKLSLKPIHFWTLKEYTCSYAAFRVLWWMGAGDSHLGIPKGTFLSSLIQDVEMQALQYCIERELALLLSTVHELKSFSFIIPVELIIVGFFSCWMLSP